MSASVEQRHTQRVDYVNSKHRRKRGTERGNSTLELLTDDERIQRKTKGTSHQSTTVQIEDPFISVDNNDINEYEQNIANYKTLVKNMFVCLFAVLRNTSTTWAISAKTSLNIE
jgi:hypothetical protein